MKSDPLDVLRIDVEDRDSGTYVVFTMDEDLAEHLQECGVDQDLDDLGELVEALEHIIEWMDENFA